MKDNKHLVYSKNGRRAFGWTTLKGSKPYAVLAYRVLKDGRMKLAKEVRFARRITAKRRAQAWLKRYNGKA